MSREGFAKHYAQHACFGRGFPFPIFYRVKNRFVRFGPDLLFRERS